VRSLFVSLAGVLVLTCMVTGPTDHAQTRSAQPRYAQNHALVRPQNYRQWIYLSTGFGMEYSAAGGKPRMFTNVFVTPYAYRQFVKTGKWPDETMFVLEERFAASKDSINKAGRYETDLAGLAVSVKDARQFLDKWAYFSFRGGERTSQPKPKEACWECHNSHGAVDNTFVQFYPTLKTLAQNLRVYDGAKAAGLSARR
jgi:Cytochrome P460